MSDGRDPTVAVPSANGASEGEPVLIVEDLVKVFPVRRAKGLPQARDM